MKQPDGFHVINPDDVLCLRKPLYGLKQAGRVWNQTLRTTLLNMGFCWLKWDDSLYIYKRDTVHIIMFIYIEYITIASSSTAESDRTIQELSKGFESRDLGPTCFLPDIQLVRNRFNRCIMLSQR